MRPIHKFILHVVHNWTNELNEAYSEGAIKKFIEKFREEADDLNINITDDQLKKYIDNGVLSIKDGGITTSVTPKSKNAQTTLSFNCPENTEIKVELAIWQLFIIMVEAVGQVSNEPEAAYDPDPIEEEIDDDKFSPMFLYVFGIIFNIQSKNN